MTGEDGGRERHFEAVIGLMLDALASIYPDRVEVTRRPRVALAGAGELAPAFELAYRLAGGPQGCLIECHCEGSEDAARRFCEAGPRLAGRRLQYLYHLDGSLAAAVLRELEAAGVEHYSLVRFGVFLDEINRSLAAGGDPADAAVFRLELMKAGRRYPALRTAFSRMRSDSSFAAQVGS